jgi:transposase
VAKFRQASKSSGAKSDPLDAEDILEILLKHLDRLKPLEPDTSETRLLGRLVEDRRKAVNLRTRQLQALEAALKEYYPQALELCSGNLTSRFSHDLLKKWPSLEAFQQAKPATIRQFYYGHNLRSPAVIAGALQVAQNAQVLTTDLAIVESGKRLALLYAQLIQSLNQAIADYDQRIEVVFHNHPELHLFQALPGGGAVMAPRLLAFFGTDRSRFQSAENIASFTGIAPVTQQSGRSKVVYARLACPKFDRQTFHEFARVSVPYCQWARNYVQYYTQTKGKTYHTAVRALAFKWIRILFRCWQSRTPYDDTKYMAALKKAGSRFATLHLEKAA